MPGSDEDEPLPGSRLDIRLSRPFFAFTGKNGMILASVLLVLAPAGWPLSVWLTGMAQAAIVLIWAAAFLAVGVPFMLEAVAHRRWAKGGQDLWLRISADGMEFAELVFWPLQHKLAWPDIAKWRMADFPAGRRIVWITTAGGRRHAIDPMDYLWTAHRAPDDGPLAVALGHDIEALLKLYAGDRQGGHDA